MIYGLAGDESREARRAGLSAVRQPFVILRPSLASLQIMRQISAGMVANERCLAVLVLEVTFSPRGRTSPGYGAETSWLWHQLRRYLFMLSSTATSQAARGVLVVGGLCAVVSAAACRCCSKILINDSQSDKRSIPASRKPPPCRFSSLNRRDILGMSKTFVGRFAAT